MILSEHIVTPTNNRNYKRFLSFGYKFKVGDEILVSVKHLSVEVYRKQQKSSFRIKTHYLNNLKYRGTYELGISKDIEIKEGPSIRYSMANKNRTYYSDFMLPKYNLICEIKSTYTLFVDYDENLIKQEYSIKNGYNFLFIVNKNYEELEKIINR